MGGMNTLKYYDLSFLYSSNYRYDPDKMFEFKGDTGVYQMYAFCRILSIIAKSDYELEDTTANAIELLRDLHENPGDVSDIAEFEDLTSIDRDLMFVLTKFYGVFERARSSMTVKPI